MCSPVTSPAHEWQTSDIFWYNEFMRVRFVKSWQLGKTDTTPGNMAALRRINLKLSNSKRVCIEARNLTTRKNTINKQNYAGTTDGFLTNFTIMHNQND